MAKLAADTRRGTQIFCSADLAEQNAIVRKAFIYGY